MGSDQQFCLRWHNYQSSLMASLPQFLDNENLTDVTLSAGGRNIRAHKVVLSACSQYFNELFKVLQPMEHPVIVVPGTTFPDLCALVTFMYSGEVNIYQEQLQGLLSMADAMQIRGLAEVSGTGKSVTPSSKKENNATSKRSRFSTQPTPILSNLGLENNPAKCATKPLQTETVDNCSQYKKEKLDSEVYAGLARTMESIQQNEYESGLQLGNSPKIETGFSGQFINNFEQLTDNVKSHLMKRTAILNESEVLQLKDLSSNTSNVSPTQEPKIKAENESSNVMQMAEKDIRPSLRRSVISSSEGKKKFITDSDNQGQISPESDDSNGNNFMSENVQVNQVLPVTALKLKSPFYGNKQLVPNLSASCNSKLYATCFVCGKQLSNQYNLRVHLETHQNINYACNVCSHISRSRDALRKHVSYRHPGEGRERIGFGNITKEARLTVGNSYTAPSKKPKVIDNNNENKHTDT